jgi:hypothetical protein
MSELWPVTMSRDEVRDLCRTLGFDPAMVSQITVYPTYVEVTVTVPIAEEPTP